MQLPPRVNVLGVGISVLRLDTATRLLLQAARESCRGYVCVTGVHGVMESREDPVLRRIHNESLLTTPDGMPMVWLGRRAGFRDMDRVYGPDLMARVMDEGREQGATHYLFGGNDGVVGELKARLESRFPGVRIIGVETPPFRPLTPGEEQDLAHRLDNHPPDFFWVGLSTPKQERFMARMMPRLNTRVMLGVGAAFDFHAGRVVQAPRWVQRSGFEWLYRLSREPRRLWRRYARNNPRFMVQVLCQQAGWRQFPLDPEPDRQRLPTPPPPPPPSGCA